jgi:alpha-tubulin suppressor-like RCC1 family protein
LGSTGSNAQYLLCGQNVAAVSGANSEDELATFNTSGELRGQWVSFVLEPGTVGQVRALGYRKLGIGIYASLGQSLNSPTVPAVISTGSTSTRFPVFADYSNFTTGTKVIYALINSDSRDDAPEVCVQCAAANPIDAYNGGAHVLSRNTYGQAYGWGSNTNGVVGSGTNSQVSSPSAISDAAGLPYVCLSANVYVGHAVRTNSTVATYGSNDSAQATGVAQSTIPYGTNVAVTAKFNSTTDLKGALGVGGGADFALALLTEGSGSNTKTRVYAWGEKARGRLGDGDTGTTSAIVNYPQLISVDSSNAEFSGVKSLSCGYYDSVAIKNNGTVWVWGWSYGSRPTQLSLPTGITAVRATMSGWGSLLVIGSDAKVYGYGDDSYGQLGRGSTAGFRYTFDSVKSALNTPLNNVVAAAGGYDHSVFLLSNGTMYACGANGGGWYTDGGRLGDGTTTAHTYAQQVSLPSNAGLSALWAAAGASTSYLRKADGSVLGWGANGVAQLGLGNTASPVLTPSSTTTIP